MDKIQLKGFSEKNQVGLDGRIEVRAVDPFGNVDLLPDVVEHGKKSFDVLFLGIVLAGSFTSLPGIPEISDYQKIIDQSLSFPSWIVTHPDTIRLFVKVVKATS